MALLEEYNKKSDYYETKFLEIKDSIEKEDIEKLDTVFKELRI